MGTNKLLSCIYETVNKKDVKIIKSVASWRGFNFDVYLQTHNVIQIQYDTNKEFVTIYVSSKERLIPTKTPVFGAPSNDKSIRNILKTCTRRAAQNLTFNQKNIQNYLQKLNKKIK